MTIKITSRGFLLAATIATLASTQFTSPAMAYVCKNSYKQGEALSNSVVTGKANARKAWSTAAKSAYGLEWSVWTIAANRTTTCEWTGAKHYCIARAKPCQYVVQ